MVELHCLGGFVLSVSYDLPRPTAHVDYIAAMPSTAVANEFLTAARGMGLVEKDFAVVYEVLRQMSGVSR